MPFTRRRDVPSAIASLVPKPYRLVVDEERRPDLGYFAEFWHGSELLKSLEIYPYVVGGPGPNRPPDERRVQLELSRRAEAIVRDPPKDRIGVMLGLRDKEIDGDTPAVPLILAFSFGIYRDMTSRSSLQFPKHILLEAEVLGVSAYTKIARTMGPPVQALTLAMSPQILPLFFCEIAGHLTQSSDWEPQVVMQVQETARRFYSADQTAREEVISPTVAIVAEAPEERERRRMIARMVTAPLRDWRFAAGVQRAYGFRCAACDVQLDLVEAAHIDPVENLDSSDDISNGVALCSLHHKSYDQGLLDIKADGAIIVIQSKVDELSAKLRDGGLQAFRAALRQRIRRPENEEHWPDSKHFERRERFRRSSTHND